MQVVEDVVGQRLQHVGRRSSRAHGHGKATASVAGHQQVGMGVAHDDGLLGRDAGGSTERQRQTGLGLLAMAGIGTGDGPPLTGRARGMRIDGAVPTLQS